MYGFTLNNRHSSEFGLYIKTQAFPALAQKRYTKEIIPNRHSSFKFENGYEDKIIELQCTLIESNYEQRRFKIREIMKWLSDGGNIIFDYEKDKYYIVKFYDEVNIEAVATTDIFIITFTAYPFQYSNDITEYEINVTEYKEAGLINSGTIKASPIIIIDGTADSISLSNDTGCFTIQNINQKTQINTDKMISYTLDAYGKKINKLLDCTGEFLYIPVGASNLTIDGTNLNCTVTINYRNTYL